MQFPETTSPVTHCVLQWELPATYRSWGQLFLWCAVCGPPTSQRSWRKLFIQCTVCRGERLPCVRIPGKDSCGIPHVAVRDLLAMHKSWGQLVLWCAVGSGKSFFLTSLSTAYRQYHLNCATGIAKSTTQAGLSFLLVFFFLGLLDPSWDFWRIPDPNTILVLGYGIFGKYQIVGGPIDPHGKMLMGFFGFFFCIHLLAAGDRAFSRMVPQLCNALLLEVFPFF